MKIIILVVALMAVAPSARGETFAFVDQGRVYQESTEAQRIAAEVDADKSRKEAEVKSAVDAWEKAQQAKAKSADVEALRGKAAALFKMNADDHAKHAKEAWASFRKRLSGVTAKLEAERHVKILGAAPLVEDKRDLTDELIKRVNESDVVALAAKVAALESEKARPSAAPPAAEKK